MVPLAEERLIRKYREGDEDAFRLLFERNALLLRARIQRKLPRWVLRKMSISDVLQETSLVSFRRRGEFKGGTEDSFRNWLLGIVDMKIHRAVQEYSTAKKRDAAREVSRIGRMDTAHFVGTQPSPSQVAIASELRNLAQEAVSRLRPDYREVLGLVREEQLTLREVAHRMGRSREAVKKLYGRALFQFTEIFDEMRDGHE